MSDITRWKVFTLGLVVVLAILTILTSLALRVEAQATEPDPLLVGTNTVVVAQELTLPITIPSAPTGVSGYLFDISVANPDLAAITQVSTGYSTVKGLEVSSLQWAAADLADIWPGASSYPDLGFVTVKGLAPGATTLNLTVLMIDDDAGVPIQLRDSDTLLLIQ